MCLLSRFATRCNLCAVYRCSAISTLRVFSICVQAGFRVQRFSRNTGIAR